MTIFCSSWAPDCRREKLESITVFLTDDTFLTLHLLQDYFKEWIEEDRVESTYYKPNEAGGSVPYLPVLVGILFAVLGATMLVVQQTGGSH